jgi:hypothetical protein
MVFGLRVFVVGGGVRVFFVGELDGFFDGFPAENFVVFNFYFHFNIIFGRAIAFKSPRKQRINL